MTHLLAVLALTVLAQHPDLSGHWTLNPTQSDNPRDSVSQATGGGGGDGRMRGIGGGGRGGFGGGRGGRGGRGGFGGGGGMSEQQRARMRQTMQLVFTAPASLEIVTGDSSVTLVAEDDSLVLPSNGRKVRREPAVDGEGAVDIKGRWQGSDFIVERSVSGGGKVTEDYLRSATGKQLFVIVSYTGGRRQIKFRRIYDAAD